MATKKQKREAAEAKHAAFMENERAIGLRAQQQDRQERERRQRMAAAEARRRRDAATSKLLNQMFGAEEGVDY